MDYPAQRDFVKELAVTCRKAGLGLFIYYSVGIDWHHPYFLPNTMYDPARPHYKEVPESYRFRNCVLNMGRLPVYGLIRLEECISILNFLIFRKYMI